MAKEADNLAKMPPPNGWQSWPRGINAAARLGISVRRMRLLIESGNLTATKCPDKSVRYNPEEIEELASDLRTVSKRTFGEEDDSDDSSLDELEERPRSAATVDQINKTLVTALQNANSMVLQMHELLSKGAKAQADVQDRVIQRLLEREEAREKVIGDNYLQRENYYNQQLERDLAAKQAGNVEQRRAEMWTITKSHLDKLIEMAYVKFGMPPEVVKKLEPALQLLQKLSPTQMQMLLSSGFLTPEQEKLVRQIIDDAPSADEQAATEIAKQCERIVEQDRAKAEQARKDRYSEAKPSTASTEGNTTPCANPPQEPPSPPVP